MQFCETSHAFFLILLWTVSVKTTKKWENCPHHKHTATRVRQMESHLSFSPRPHHNSRRFKSRRLPHQLSNRPCIVPQLMSCMFASIVQLLSPPAIHNFLQRRYIRLQTADSDYEKLNCSCKLSFLEIVMSLELGPQIGNEHTNCPHFHCRQSHRTACIESCGTICREQENPSASPESERFRAVWSPRNQWPRYCLP